VTWHHVVSKICIIHNIINLNNSFLSGVCVWGCKVSQLASHLDWVKTYDKRPHGGFNFQLITDPAVGMGRKIYRIACSFVKDFSRNFSVLIIVHFHSRKSKGKKTETFTDTLTIYYC
jgi:hypothetical protein